MATQRFLYRFISLLFGVILAQRGLLPPTALHSNNPTLPQQQRNA